MTRSTMHRRPLSGFASAALLTLCAACQPTLPSPAAGLLHFATPNTGGEGVTTVTAAVGAGGEAFGPGIIGGAVQVRHGVRDNIDVGGEVTAVVALGDQVANPPHRGIYAARAFAQITVVPRWLALHAGLGGGASAAGGYMSPDIGITFGYENPWLVPYLHGNFLVSTPLTKRTLDLTLDDPTTLRFRTPYTAIGSQFGVGIRIPIGPHGAPIGSIFVEGTLMLLAGNDTALDGGFETHRGLATIGVAYQHRFGQVVTHADSTPVH